MPTTATKRREEPHDLGSSSEPEMEPIVLTPRDLEVFIAEWDNPGKLHPRLEEAARRYRSRRRSDAG
jgi:hypothetical protein